MADKIQTGMTTRQKVTIGLFVIVILVILYQVYGLFSSGTVTEAPAAAVAPAQPVATNTAMQKPVPAALPQVAQPPKAQPMSQREMELMKMQQETQAKYLAALNELQMLKVSREIAETNQAIMNAKLASITAEKGIVDLLAPASTVTTATYAQGLNGNAPTTTTTTTQTAAPRPAIVPEVAYTVISVSQIHYKWTAVVGYQGSLYNVSIGDVLPPDQSKVVSIDKSGVVLMKDNVRKKISLVPII